MDYDGDDRSQEIGGVLAKVVAVIVGIGLVIGIGTLVMVKFLGLNEETTTSPTLGTAAPNSGEPLPTTALPVPGSSETADPDDDFTFDPEATPATGLNLTGTPALARPGERINLTGTYVGKDGISLVVQRMEDGVWNDFAGVDANVRVGTFATFVMTSKAGDQQFRVYDPQADLGSNPVTITID